MTAQAAIDRPAVNPPCKELVQHRRYDRTTRLFDLARGLPPQRGGAGLLTRLKWSFMADEGSLSRIGSPPGCGAAVAAFPGRS